MLRDLMVKRYQAHQSVLRIRNTRSVVEAYKDACRILQKYTRARRSEWGEMKVEELQRAADRNDMKGFYSGLKEVWCTQTIQLVHLIVSDGLETFTNRKSVMAYLYIIIPILYWINLYKGRMLVYLSNNSDGTS